MAKTLTPAQCTALRTGKGRAATLAVLVRLELMDADHNVTRAGRNIRATLDNGAPTLEHVAYVVREIARVNWNAPQTFHINEAGARTIAEGRPLFHNGSAVSVVWNPSTGKAYVYAGTDILDDRSAVDDLHMVDAAEWARATVARLTCRTCGERPATSFGDSPSCDVCASPVLVARRFIAESIFGGASYWAWAENGARYHVVTGPWDENGQHHVYTSKACAETIGKVPADVFAALPTRESTADLSAIVADVKAHAQHNYAAGWDVIVECYTDEEIIEATQGAETLADALADLRPVVDHWKEGCADAVISSGEGTVPVWAEETPVPTPRTLVRVIDPAAPLTAWQRTERFETMRTAQRRAAGLSEEAEYMANLPRVYDAAEVTSARTDAAQWEHLASWLGESVRNTPAAPRPSVRLTSRRLKSEMTIDDYTRRVVLHEYDNGTRVRMTLDAYADGHRRAALSYFDASGKLASRRSITWDTVTDAPADNGHTLTHYTVTERRGVYYQCDACGSIGPRDSFRNFPCGTDA